METTQSRKGSITVKTNDIFPIIKKWLYSEHDIFIRELIANATDAITKRATLGRSSNEEIPEGFVQVEVDRTKKTIKIIDNGIGMTEEEVEKYIAQLAFSGAQEFVEKIKASKDNQFDIIGKFGLGFYSSFMVAEKVEIDSLSMNPNAKATKWVCTGDTEYSFLPSDKKEVGTTITLHVNSDGEEFLSGYKISAAAKRFCEFMPYKINVIDTYKIEEDKKQAEKEKSEGKEEKYITKPVTENIINDTTPLWKKNPSELKDEDYTNFFHTLYPTDPTPLFWIHLKVDHPFTLEGILYFPKLNPTRPFNESSIKLYCKQVFVSDNVKNIIPEFLSLLKGVIDSPDIPLNVSRSSLQGDPNIKKISNYIVKKVSEALTKLYNNDRPKYEKIWEDIGIFVKYGVISNDKFDADMRSKVIYKNSSNKYISIDEYLTASETNESYKEKLKDKIIYFEKDKSDPALREELLAENIHCIETDQHIDPHFMQHVEHSPIGEKQLKFVSVDSEIGNLLTNDNSDPSDVEIQELFKKFLAKDKDQNKNDKDEESNQSIEISKTKNCKVPAYLKIDEQTKRFRNMAKSMGQDNIFPVRKTLVVNTQNALVQNALKLSKKGTNPELVEKLCHHVEDLAQISSEGLTTEEKNQFVMRSQELLQELTNIALH